MTTLDEDGYTVGQEHPALGGSDSQDLFFCQRLLLEAVTAMEESKVDLPVKLASWWENSPMNDDANVIRVLRSIPDEDIDSLNRYLQTHDQLPREFD